MPLAKQAKTGVQAGGAAAQGLRAGSDLLTRQAAKRGDDVASAANKKATEATAKGGCFVAGTMVLAYEGYKSIQNIQVGDWV